MPSPRDPPLHTLLMSGALLLSPGYVSLNQMGSGQDSSFFNDWKHNFTLLSECSK